MLKRRRLHAFKRMRTSAVNASARHSRKTRSQALYRRFSLATVRKVIFTDEKDFTLEVPTNRQNDGVYAKGRKSDISTNRLYHHRNRFSKKLMVSAGVSWNGKTEIFFIDPKKTKVNQKTYIDFVKTSLLPECRRLYPDNDFVFMQDSAPSHLAKATRNFLRDNTPNFRWKSEHSRSVWLQSLRSMHRFVDQKRNDYWRSKTDSQASARELW